MNGRETEGQMRARLQAEFEVEKERLEREIRAEEDQRRIDEARIIGGLFIRAIEGEGAWNRGEGTI